MEFHDFQFHQAVAAGLKAAAYKTPTPIQERGIPVVMKGGDVLGLAQTGTGKTAAFLLPILHRLMTSPGIRIRALILAPTRELAEQISRDAALLGKKTWLKSCSVYGGVGIHKQAVQLKKCQIVAACPGRLLDHIGRGNVDFSELEVLVLDEADMMFDMGFLPDIRKIIKALPPKRQNLLFSATMPPEIRRLAGEVLVSPKTVKIGSDSPAETVSHTLFPVAQHQKTSLLMEILRSTETQGVLVFTRTKHGAKRLGEQLTRAGHPASSLQGNLSQGKRQRALDSFRSGECKILVATDIAARGIDVSRVSHVINFDMPGAPEAYIHRIGRTGRANRKGEAFTFATRDDREMVRNISKLLGAPIESRKMPGFEYNAPKGGLKRPGKGEAPSKPKTFRKKARRFPGKSQAA